MRRPKVEVQYEEGECQEDDPGRQRGEGVGGVDGGRGYLVDGGEGPIRPAAAEVDRRAGGRRAGPRQQEGPAVVRRVQRQRRGEWLADQRGHHGGERPGGWL